MKTKPEILLWKDEFGVMAPPSESWNRFSLPFPGLDDAYESICSHCGGRYSSEEFSIPDVVEEQGLAEDEGCWGGKIDRRTCESCGFWHAFEAGAYFDYELGTHVKRAISFGILKKLGIDSPEVAFDELGRHLLSSFSDVYAISPRRFEELVGDVYRNHGYDVTLRSGSKDGGIDLVLLQQSEAEPIIVQCKRWAAHRKVNVQVVRELLGVQLREQAKEAKLVTTTQFTSVAREEVGIVNDSVDGYHLELIDAFGLLKALEVYGQPPESDEFFTRRTFLPREDLVQLSWGRESIL